MRSFVLVLLVAASAFAVPTVLVEQYNINEVAPLPDNGRPVNSAVIDRVFELVDGADANVYTVTIEKILNDMADQLDARTQAIAVLQALAILGEIANGIPGDSCAAAAAINNYAAGGSAASYRAVLARAVDTVAQASVNPSALRYTTGPRQGCAGGGRSNNLEAAWNRILDGCNPYTIPLLNEEYCAAKRLYNTISLRSNNVAAAATAAAAVADAGKINIAPVANFLRVAASGGNVAQAAAKAKVAILS